MNWDKCLDITHLSIFNIEQFLIDCSGTTHWRDNFVTGVVIFILLMIVAFPFSRLFGDWR